jgi:hypothetical protein
MRKEFGKSGIRKIEKEAMMIRVFDIDEPTTELELDPNTIVRQIDLLHYLNTNCLRYVGEPVPVKDIGLSEAMTVDTGLDEEFGASVVVRVLSAEERENARAAN